MSSFQDHQSEKPWQSDIDHLQWLAIAGIHSFSNKRILDLGCGSGYICHKAMKEGAKKALGIDIITPKLAESGFFEFQNANLDSQDWHEGIKSKFDLILAFDILEHLASPYWFLASCEKLLSDNGVIILTTPNTLSWERFYNPSNWSGASDPQHKTLFTKYSLEFLLNKTGFTDIKLSAPMRAFKALGPLQPQVGGQILAKIKK